MIADSTEGALVLIRWQDDAFAITGWGLTVILIVTFCAAYLIEKWRNK